MVGEFRGVDDDYNLCLMRWPNLEVARASSLRLCSVDALIWSNDLQERSRKKAHSEFGDDINARDADGLDGERIALG